MNSLTIAEQLKSELDNLRPLDNEAEARIMQKFRLEWNYHSNNLEGNSLTYGETKALILFGITAQGKPLKDHFEITGHNEAINWILEIVKNETVLTEAFIRQLHTLLLKESSYKDALTLDGKPTRRKIEVGKYKTQPNHVITVTGETFYFAAPEETPAKMHDLLEWFRKEKEKLDVNPIILAALFHYRFIRIHPFDDGNGRVARILMNFILMQFGYPPVIIKTEDKENYLAVLRLADADELEPFIEYITQNLVRSLEIMIKGVKGESIEEPDDLDKEISLIERRLEIAGRKISLIKSREVLQQLLGDSFSPLEEYFKKQCSKFKKVYVNTAYFIQLHVPTNHKFPSVKMSRLLDVIVDQNALLTTNNSNNKEIVYVDNGILKARERIKTDDVIGVILRYKFSELNRKDFQPFEYFSTIYIIFNRTSYSISDSLEVNALEKLYSEVLSEDEIESIVKRETDKHKRTLFEKLDSFQTINEE